MEVRKKTMKRWCKLTIFFISMILVVNNIYSQVDAKIKLNSTAGATRFEIQDVAGNTKAYIDSAGNLNVSSNAVISGTLRINGNQIIDSAGTTRITLGETSTYASTVTVRGLTVQGDLTIGEGRLSDGSVTSADIKDGTILTADIADRQITSAKMYLVYGSTNSTAYIDPGTTASNLPVSITLSITTAPAVIFATYSGSWKCAVGTRVHTELKVGTDVISKVEREYNEDGGYWRVAEGVTVCGIYRVTTAGSYTITVSVYESTAAADNGGWNHYLSAFWVGSP